MAPEPCPRSRRESSSLTGEHPRHRIINRRCRCVSRLKPDNGQGDQQYREERQSYFGSQPRDWVLMRMR
jgi:hypothetical protein